MSKESGNGNSLGKGRGKPSTSTAVDEEVEQVTEQVENLDIGDSNSKQQTDDGEARDRTPLQPKKDKTERKDSKMVKRQLQFSENLIAEGWLEDHPWKDKRPDRQILKMADTVEESQVYTVLQKWQRGNRKVDLKKIYSDLPAFVSEMKGPTRREDLKRLLHSSLSEILLLNEVGSPHIKEIVQKKRNVQPQDKCSLRKQGEKFKAYSLQKDDVNPFQPSQENYWYLDCEYMLKMYLPGDSLQWFKTESKKPIEEINPEKKDERWVFIPSFRRANIALLDWPLDNDKIVTQESTLRILVVRPSEFEEYVKCCGHKFPVISLPQDEIGAGYPRLWIQKIALRLKLDFIWMIDDSVECFYEYHPTKKPDNGSYKEYRRRPFGSVFKRIENFVKEAKDEEFPIAAMSPRRFNRGLNLNHPFVCKPPQIAVFLNIKELKLKEVYYRPELQALEDMIFGYECEQRGLKVFMDNRIHLQDHQWKDTGARSPSVQQRQPEAANHK